jgi:hypothetical protein
VTIGLKNKGQHYQKQITICNRPVGSRPSPSEKAKRRETFFIAYGLRVKSETFTLFIQKLTYPDTECLGTNEVDAAFTKSSPISSEHYDLDLGNCCSFACRRQLRNTKFFMESLSLQLAAAICRNSQQII